MLSLYFVQAQELSVQHFYLAETDITANTPGTMVEDQNGNVCALIKVETTIDGFSFDVGTLGVWQVQRVGGEMWVYVPFGVRKITLSHPQLGVIREFPFPCPIEKGRTYIMKLNVPSVGRTYDHSRKQKARISVYPADAKVEIGGLSMPVVTDGVYEQELSFGIYDIIVSAERYHTEIRQIEINDPDNVQNFSIGLKQSYGWLDIEGSGNEKLFVDDKQVEFRPDRNVDIMSGHYKIRLEKPLYKPYETVVEVKDSAIVKIDPSYEINHSDLSLVVDNQAQIWIDGRKVAEGRWSGKLEYGTHKIECKKDGHRVSQKILEVTPQTVGTISLEAPAPVYGTVYVTSSPSGSDIYVDDEFVGKTPCTVNPLIGTRRITISHDGYKTDTRVIQVSETESSQINVKLTDIIDVTIKSDPDAKIFVDGKDVGKTPWRGSLISGEYAVKLQASGYNPLEKKIKVDERNTSYSFKLSKRYYYSDNFVLAATATADPIGMNPGGYLGIYLSNVYLEGYVQYAMRSSGDIYWYDNETEDDPVPYTYKPTIAGGKVGYGLIVGNRVRLTPYLGAGLKQLKGTPASGYNGIPELTSTSAVDVNGGLKLSIALSSVFELNITPEYHYTIPWKNLYKELCDISPFVKKWNNGLTISVGLGLFL